MSKEVQKIVLLGYMRGGTTFVGSLLGHREDTFYLYEPLWNIATWTNFNGKDLCDIVTDTCTYE